MSMENKNVSVNFGGLGSLLTVLFVGLKLTHYIDWSWWWVFAPLWIPAGIGLSIFGLIALFGVFVYLRETK